MKIELRNLSKNYDGSPVLKNVNKIIERTDTLIVLGKSGIGKTTLLRMIMGLEEPDSGTVTWESGDQKRISGSGYIPKAGAVFQEDRLCEGFTMLENVCMVNPDISKKQAAEELMKLLPEEAVHKRVRELSGGMKRRTALVRAMIADTELLVMDEPFSGLDEGNKQMALEYIRQNKRDRILIITAHDMKELSVSEKDRYLWLE